MTDQSNAHEALAWAKQRLDDLDTTISEIEKSSENLKNKARKEADTTLAFLQESRLKLQKYYDDLRSEADALKPDAAGIANAIEAEWIEVESTLQSFLSAAKDQADTARDIVASGRE